KLGERNQRAISLTLAELTAIQDKVGAAVRHAITGRQENSLQHVLATTTHVIEHQRGTGSNPGSKRVHQFKITLLDTRPPVFAWVPGCCRPAPPPRRHGRPARRGGPPTRRVPPPSPAAWLRPRRRRPRRGTAHAPCAAPTHARGR